MFSTVMIPSPMAKPQCHFPYKNQAGKSQKLRWCVKPQHPCSTAPNSGHYIEKLLIKEPFEHLSTWSSKWMVMVNNNREVCQAMDYL
jgi:hypothetical protein